MAYSKNAGDSDLTESLISEQEKGVQVANIAGTHTDSGNRQWDIRGKKCMVTGGCGFVGSTLVRYLLEVGAREF